MGKRNAKRVVSQPLNGLYLVLTLLLCIMMEILVFDRGYNKVQSGAELSVKEQVSLAANQLAPQSPTPRMPTSCTPWIRK